jgi:hypothetical protein
MKRPPGLPILCFVILFFAFSCRKQTATLQTSPLNAYLPLGVGKYIQYRLDSTLYINFGQEDTVRSYDVKDVVDGQITDNEDRPVYRIVRYMRTYGSLDESDWRVGLTYWITPANNGMELSENNLRFMKLKEPVTDGFNWHGNTFLPSTPYYEYFQFSNDEDINTWNYTYQDVNQPSVIDDVVYDSTVSVLQVADSSNVPIVFPDGLAYKNYWLEQYAKNIGLVYKEVEMWEYQPPNSGNPGYTTGFGLRMTIKGHN